MACIPRSTCEYRFDIYRNSVLVCLNCIPHRQLNIKSICFWRELFGYTSRQADLVVEVYVPALRDDCPAASALSVEGVDHHLALMFDEMGYGTLLSNLWFYGEGFIILEHDVVPFPGAIKALQECRA